MKLTPMARFLILTWPGPGPGTSTSSYVSTSGPPVLCTRTAATMGHSFGTLSTPRPGGGGNVPQAGAWIKRSGTLPTRWAAPAAIAPRQHIERLDRAGKRHGEVDVAARDVELESVGDQRHPDQHQEG